MTAVARPKNPIVSLFLLAIAIAIGAHLSGVPLVMVKMFVAVGLCFIYGYFAVRIITPLQIGSNGARAFVGLVLGAATLYMTWAVRIPAFSGWEVPFTADPNILYGAIIDRAGAMQISKGFGAGTSADGPSWLLLGTYLIEGVSFVGGMVLCSLASGPEKPEAAVAGAAGEAGEESSQQAA